MGGFFQRALFAWQFKDVNLLISGLVHGDSRIMIYRDITQRVPKAAPFLKFDGDPYAAVVDGQLDWIWDAYTTTDQFPYSQELALTDSVVSEGKLPLSGTVNYIRNSVKVVVNAYDGTMTYYVADPTDPIIQVWENAFPDLFTPAAQAPSDLRDHFRYPENLLQVQASQYASYHVTNPNVFYQKQDFWQIPVDPTIQGNTQAGGAFEQRSIRPYYVLMRLPGETTEASMSTERAGLASFNATPTFSSVATRRCASLSPPARATLAYLASCLSTLARSASASSVSMVSMSDTGSSAPATCTTLSSSWNVPTISSCETASSFSR